MEYSNRQTERDRKSLKYSLLVSFVIDAEVHCSKAVDL